MTTGEIVDVLDRMLDPVSRCFSLEGARELVALRADPIATARMEELADKCNEGTLTDQERTEYEACVHAGSLISILQAKARLRLKQAAS